MTLKAGSQEHRKMVSEIIRAKWQDPVYREHMRQAHIGHKHSEEHCRKISQSNMGRIFSEETRKKISLSNKGHKLGPESIAKMIATKKANPTRYWLGKKRDAETIRKIVAKKTGFKMSDAQKMKISLANRGANAWQWKGGIRRGQANQSTRDYRVWRSSVFERDDYTCFLCKKKGIYLHAHHIIEWKNSEALRYVIDNGITACKPCHKIVHKLYRGIEKALENSNVIS